MVNPAVQAETNTWISQWQDKPSSSIEETLKDCQEAENVTESLSHS
jgi:hypothetical protein